jgi:hypothetical protein
MLVSGDLERMNAFLPAEEAFARYREEKIEPLYETYRLSDHNMLKNLHMRSGQWMHASELILKVQKLNRGIFVQQQINYPEEWGFYADVLGRQTYVSGFSKYWMREFSAIVVDDRNLMEGDELRGWRTVLLRLLSFGVLSWRSISRTFGDSEGVNASRWRAATQMYRENYGWQQIQKNLN